MYPNNIESDLNAHLVVAILNKRLDFNIARDKHWYRIPVSSQQKWLARRWPPRWVAFYQTKLFGEERYAVRYFAPVLDIRRALGYELMPERGEGTEAGQRAYFQLVLGDLQQRPVPIFSRKLRRIVFIPTSVNKFLLAEEINDLFDNSPLENMLWDAMKATGIAAERQYPIQVADTTYLLDFAIQCARGWINVEADGDSYHANAERAVLDNLRNNDLAETRWQVLRFSTLQVTEQLHSYCIPKIASTIDNLGGLDQSHELPRLINLPDNERPHQPGLFD